MLLHWLSPWRAGFVTAGMALVGSLAAAAEPASVFKFKDAGDEAGLYPAVAEIAGHGCGWGDVNGDGFPDLYVGTFGGLPYKSKSNQFFINRNGKFVKDEQPSLQITGRANGAIFIDFDNDGDLGSLCDEPRDQQQETRICPLHDAKRPFSE